jgi:hypothetical protein
MFLAKGITPQKTSEQSAINIQDWSSRDITELLASTSLDDIKKALNEHNRQLGSDQQDLSKERIVAFLEWVAYFIKQEGKVTFTGGFDIEDPNLDDIVTEVVQSLNITDDGAIVTCISQDNIETVHTLILPDEFLPDFSFRFI